MESAMVWIWLAFAVGVGLRLSDRIEHAVAGPDKSINGPVAYLQKNRFKLILRLAAGIILFRLAVQTGEVTGELTALLYGYALETAVDSVLSRVGRGNGARPQEQPQ